MTEDMAKKKSTAEKTDGVLVKAATTIGRAAGKLAALVASRGKRSKGPQATPTKSRKRKAGSRSAKKRSTTKSKSTKAKKTTRKRKVKA
jgi:hypothetical protein